MLRFGGVKMAKVEYYDAKKNKIKKNKNKNLECW